MGSYKDWIIIGISGVTCGGKTTLANRLSKQFRPVHVYHQDQYFYPDDSPRHVRCENLHHNNYDILSSLDMDAMYQDILDTLNGGTKAHQRFEERELGLLEVKGKKILIVEGFTVLNFEPILKLCDLSYYFVLQYAACAARRALRLYDPPDVEGYFDQCVWPSHLQYRRQIEQNGKVVILDGTQPDCIDRVLGDLYKMGATKIV